MEKLYKNFRKLKLHEWKIEAEFQSPLKPPYETKIVHLITKEEFYLKKINFTQMPQNNQYYASYQNRSIYLLPGTPRIIMPDPPIIPETHAPFEILVQTSSESIDQYFKKLSVSHLFQTFRGIVSTLTSLFAKYGAFRLTKRMLMVTSCGQVLVWHNQDFSQNKIQIKEENNQKNESQEKNMLLNLIGILSVLSNQAQHQQFYSYIRKKILGKVQISFDHTIEIINNYPCQQKAHQSPKKQTVQLRNSGSRKNAQLPTFLRNRAQKQSACKGKNKKIKPENGKEIYIFRKLDDENNGMEAQTDKKIHETVNFKKGTRSMLESFKNQSLRMIKSYEGNNTQSQSNKETNFQKKSDSNFGSFVKSSSQYLFPPCLQNQQTSKSPHKSMSELHICNNIPKVNSPLGVKNKWSSTASGSARATYTIQNMKQFANSTRSTRFDHAPTYKIIQKCSDGQQTSFGKIIQIPKMQDSKKDSNLTFAMEEIENDIIAVLDPSNAHTKGSTIIEKQLSSLENEIQNVLFG